LEEISSTIIITAGDLFGVGSDAEVGQPTASNTAMGSR
jgi:hypothetical protein